ncbi:MAG: TRC40/GET3/ArsA family transport-energizing ATPase [Euryarchaeota archaeon]|nr:TRC40/GET3/ArsA family transport-energizing ATPase [Euryarchaeota archaeon]
MNELMEPTQQGKTKFVFFSGKGGVGKSTMSCATAVWLAKKGYKTIIVTTDPAPNLSDIFNQEIGHKITPIDGVDNLSAIEINPDIASEEYRERMIAPMRALLDEKNLQVMKEQMNSPCVEEVAAFDQFIEFMNDPVYDVVVFDTAPTGHTIRLLELPSGWCTELDKGGSTCIGPSASLQGAKLKYETAIAYLQDGDATSFVFVLRPENSSILETKRSAAELSKLGITTSFLIINGMLPEAASTDRFFKKKWDEEQAIVKRIEDEFEGKKLVYPLRDSEISGLSFLESVGQTLYENRKEPTVVSEEAAIGPSYDEQSVSSTFKKKQDLLPFFVPVNGTRYLFFTGKGGVGKSTVACATSVYLAQKGFKTLIVTTDPASHLQNIFGQYIEPEPTAIAGVDNLFAARIDQKKAWDAYSKRILRAVEDKSQEIRTAVEEDLNSPCAQEMAAFERFMSYFELRGYDVLIFDTAPTGHTLRLLELPSDWKGFIDLGSLTKQTSEETMNKYAHVIEAMRDREQSTFIFVVYPEYTPMMEAWRASEDLRKQVGIRTALIAVNYLLPEKYGRNAFFNNRRRQQERYIEDIKQRFKTPLFIIPLLDHEPEGMDDLKLLQQEVF